MINDMAYYVDAMSELYILRERPNNAFSERHPGIGQNASFSRKIGTFRLSFVQTARRSFVTNDGPIIPWCTGPLEERQGQAAGSLRVFWAGSEHWQYPVSEPLSLQPQVPRHTPPGQAARRLAARLLQLYMLIA